MTSTATGSTYEPQRITTSCKAGMRHDFSYGYFLGQGGGEYGCVHCYLVVAVEPSRIHNRRATDKK